MYNDRGGFLVSRPMVAFQRFHASGIAWIGSGNSTHSQSISVLNYSHARFLEAVRANQVVAQGRPPAIQPNETRTEAELADATDARQRYFEAYVSDPNNSWAVDETYLYANDSTRRAACFPEYSP